MVVRGARERAPVGATLRAIFREISIALLNGIVYIDSEFIAFLTDLSKNEVSSTFRCFVILTQSYPFARANDAIARAN